jgi:hypothetical protein
MLNIHTVLSYEACFWAMIQHGCAFGGTPNTWLDLAPNLLQPAQGYRVISGAVWWTLIFWPWRKYRAARAAGIPAPAPSLTPPGAPGVFFTDRESLQGLVSPGDYASRLALPPRAHAEFQRYGCAVIEFPVPPSLSVIAPAPYPNCQQGLTPHGAREWLAQGAIELREDMRVTYIDTVASGPRFFLLPL